MAPLLHVGAVSKLYGRSGPAAVSDVSLTVMPGRITGIVGESGSGKTTLARMMAGLLTPSSGAVSFQGAALRGLGAGALRRLRRHLQYVHQDPASALDPRMRIGAILHEPLLIHTRDNAAQRLAQIRTMLDAVGVAPQILDRYPHQISGGQQRRVALARILVLRPSLIILDEPTAGLDLLVQASLLALLQALRQQFGLTFVLVTHDIAVVEAMCDEIVVMYSGRVVERAATQPLLKRPLHPYTIELLAARPRLDGPRVIGRTVLRRSDAAPSPSADACAVAGRCPVAAAQCSTRRPVLARFADRDIACWVAGAPAGPS